uniref:Uncharacterized protein n=1 Tax=Leersia perrieri TaxID=77586 RepID=A0A0D9WQZ6_9ORYZ
MGWIRILPTLWLTINYKTYPFLLYHGYFYMSKFMCAVLNAVCWQLWCTRNDMIFRDRVLNSPLIVFFHVLALLSQWWVIWKTGDAENFDRGLQKLKEAVEALRDRNGIG